MNPKKRFNILFSGISAIFLGCIALVILVKLTQFTADQTHSQMHMQKIIWFPVILMFLYGAGCIVVWLYTKPTGITPTVSTPKSSDDKACQICGKALDQRVVNYCNAHRQRFAGRLLCRSCQSQ